MKTLPVKINERMTNKKKLFTRIFIPLCILAIYCFSFSSLSSIFLTLGVNYAFTHMLWMYLLLVIIVLAIPICVTAFKNRAFFSPDDLGEKLPFTDILLLLLPLTPIVQYIINNSDILSSADIFYIISFFLLFSGLLILVIPIILRRIVSIKILEIIGVAFTFTITSMALLSKQFSWLESGNFLIQLVFFCSVFVCLWLLINQKSRIYIYTMIMVLFFVNGLNELRLMVANSSVSSSENDFLSLLEGKTPVYEPSIYLFVYDSYVTNETLSGYGIDNYDQESWLLDKGFSLYPKTYSIADGTIGSMSRVLNVSDFFYGPKRQAVSGRGVVQQIYKELGYETYGVFSSDFMFRGIGSGYDHSIPKVTTLQSSLLISAILIGEFRFDISFDKQNYEEFISSKRAMIEQIDNQKVFVYSHTNLPGHSQNSGKCREDEIKIYHEKLIRANTEMKQDVELILSTDPNALIVIAGDHGPYLTKNCYATGDEYDISEITRLDIQDRFGTFLAIKFPTVDYEEYDEITILQDIFPVIFAYMYQDSSILDSKLRPVISAQPAISGVSVNNGKIKGGSDDGEELFLGSEK